MPADLLQELKRRVVIADGAMGTELYKRGVFINKCFEELNRSAPEMVMDVHRAYRQAGAEVLTTNSYGADHTWLAPHGLEGVVRELNLRAAELARDVARDEAWVAGSVGPLRQPLDITGEGRDGLSVQEAMDAFGASIQALLEGGVDLIAFETFRQPAMLRLAIEVARGLTDKPILASFVAPELDPSESSDVLLQPDQWARKLERAGADIVGTNCVNGPVGVLDAVKRMSRAVGVPVSAMPNAGYPEVVNGRTLYLASPEYMAEYARRFVLAGARMVGGCCGTTPDMIREMAAFVRSIEVQEIEHVTVPPSPKQIPAEPPPLAERSKLGAWLANPSERFAVSVELAPPRGTNPSRTIRAAAKLFEAGVDFINIPDGPRAVPRMNAAVLARRIRDEVGIDTIIHVCCRDRNTLGLQMDLIGYEIDQLRNVLCVTGDPPKMGNHPNATAVFDLDAVGLLRMVRNLNHGLDMGSTPLKGSTAFVPGCGCNPGAADLEREVARLGRKIDAGASFVFSQPVYEPSLLHSFLDRISGFKKIPFLVGILPLASLANAEFFHNEVPGMQVPALVLERLEKAGNKDAQAAEGIRIAQETLVQVRNTPGVDGAYLFPPFGKVSGVLEVLSAIER